ncbi:MAG: acylphosphatase [Thermoprotei archaeon]
MKLKITILGERVQDVGYRLHLLSLARGLVGFEAENLDHDKLVVYAEGDDDVVARFKEVVEKSRPPMSKVSSISYEPYTGYVLPISEYRSQLSLEQLVKIAQTGIEVRDDLKEMKGDIKEMKDDVKEIKGDIKEIKSDVKEIKDDVKEIKSDVKDVKSDTSVIRLNTEVIKANTEETKVGVKQVSEIQKEMLSEVKGVRSDLRTHVDERLRRLEADVQAIKEKLGLSP